MTARRQPPAAQEGPRERILATALKQIHTDGLTVSLDHLRLEQVIKDSGVSRATAYRIWPNKQAFLTDVILAAVATTTLTGTSERPLALFDQLFAQQQAFFTDERARRHLIVDAIRLLSALDIELMASFSQWTTYLALTVTARGLSDDGLREALLSALAETDAAFANRRAEVLALLPDLLGYRLVPPLEGAAGFQLVSTAAGALMNGLLIKAIARPAILSDTFELAAFGAGPLVWTLPSYTLTSQLLSFLEPDPEVTWDQAQQSRFEAGLDRVLAAASQGPSTS